MKYSFIIPYYKRPGHLWNTLISYRHYYASRNDYEILIIEDQASDDQGIKDSLIGFPDLPIRHLQSPVANGVNPVMARNMAAMEAKGEYLINTNPECFHKVNVLNGFDAILTPKDPAGWGPGHPNWNTPSFRNKYGNPAFVYIICVCENVEFKGRADSFPKLETAKHLMWYDHPQHNNRRLHWCSCISKKLYLALGGFDENYHNLVGFDDDDFKTKVIVAEIPIRYEAGLVVCHIDHPRTHQDESKRKESLEYYQKKWIR